MLMGLLFSVEHNNKLPNIKSINYNSEIVSPLQIKTVLQTTPFKISEVFLTPKKII